MRAPDPIRLLAAANPLPAGETAALDHSVARDSIRARIDRQRATGSPRRSRTRLPRRTILAAALFVVLAVPALAFSSALDALFGFSNQGTTVSTSQLSLSDVQILERDNVEVGGAIKLLATRGNLAFYVSRTTDGRTCLLTGPAGGVAPTQIAIGTPCEKDFPSPQQPLLGKYVLASHAGGGVQTVASLDGLAADGVSTVEALDADGRVVVQAPVSDNVYFTPVTNYSNTPITVPATKIVALDANGNVIYTEAIPQPAYGG